jgi:ribosomal protein L32
MKRAKRARRWLKKLFGSRVAIEPIIGHLKSGHRLCRNCLKGTVGDDIHPILSSAGFNLLKHASIQYDRRASLQNLWLAAGYAGETSIWSSHMEGRAAYPVLIQAQF